MSQAQAAAVRRVVESANNSVQLTATAEVDLTAVTRLISRVADSHTLPPGMELGQLPFIIKAVAEALRAFPKMNASYEKQSATINYPDTENVGIAHDTPLGTVVPVIRNAGDLGIQQLARRLRELRERVALNTLSVNDRVGGTFTVTEYEEGGVLFDTPIITEPQVAALGVGATTRRPMVVTDADGNESIAIRDMAYLSLTYDNRLIEVSDATRFVGLVKSRLEAGTFQSDFPL
jgi:2-oxoglutarate dehydrogenase E2 component (dihydrolipoamide succinyltransferase)